MNSVQASQNPYIVGPPIKEPQDFFGRKQELRQIFERIATAQSTEVVGERRSGRTSLLYQICNQQVQTRCGLDGTSYLFCLVDCQSGIDTPPEFYRRAFADIAPEQLRHSLDSIDARNYQQIVREIFEALSPRRVVLLLDEFHYIVGSDAFPIDFYNFLRSLAITYDLSITVATTERLYKICPTDRVGSPFFNIFLTIYVGSFTEEEFDEFVEETSARSGVNLKPYREHLLDLAGRFPYFLQLACWHYVEDLRKYDELVSDKDHERIRHAFASQAEDQFNYIWKHLDSDERGTVLALVTHHPPPSQEVMKVLELKGYVLNGRLFSSVFAEFVERKVEEGQKKKDRKAREPEVATEESVTRLEPSSRVSTVPRWLAVVTLIAGGTSIAGAILGAFSALTSSPGGAFVSMLLLSFVLVIFVLSWGQWFLRFGI